MSFGALCHESERTTHPTGVVAARPTSEFQRALISARHVQPARLALIGSVREPPRPEARQTHKCIRSCVTSRPHARRGVTAVLVIAIGGRSGPTVAISPGGTEISDAVCHFPCVLFALTSRSSRKATSRIRDLAVHA